MGTDSNRTGTDAASPTPEPPPSGRSSVLVAPSWRFPINPRICLALAGQTFRYCIRRKVLLVLLLFAATVLVSYWVATPTFPEKRVELVIRVSLMSASFFGVIVVVFLSATTLPDDISRRTIYSVLTKPVGRLNYLLGRALGFSMVALVLLVVMGVMSVGVIRYAAWQARRTAPAGFTLEARRHARPEHVAVRVKLDSEDLVPIPNKAGNLVLAGDWSHTMVFYFDARTLRSRRGQDVTVSFDVDIRTGEKLPKCQVKLVAVNPATGVSSEVETQLDSLRRSTVKFAPDVVDTEKGMALCMQRLTFAQAILVAPDGVTVVLAPMPFEYGFAKGLMMIFFGLTALIVIGLTASVFVSRWLAVVFAFSAYLIGVFSEVVHDLMTKLGAAGAQGLLGTGVGATGQPGAQLVQPEWIVVLNKVYLGLFRVVTIIIPDFRIFNSSTQLAGGYDVPFYLWATALEYAAIYVVVYLAVAQLLWFRREVGS